MEDGKGGKLLTPTNFLEEAGTWAITKPEAKIEAEKLLILFCDTTHCSHQNNKMLFVSKHISNCLPDDDKV